MKAFTVCLLTGILTLFPLARAGDDVDKSGPKPAPPAETAPASTFSEADCDKKIAALKKKHQSIIKKKNSQIADLKASLKKLKAENASLKEQLAEAQKPAPEPEPAPEPPTNWFPWILALILAAVGFLIGRSTAGSDSSKKS